MTQLITGHTQRHNQRHKHTQTETHRDTNTQRYNGIHKHADTQTQTQSKTQTQRQTNTINITDNCIRKEIPRQIRDSWHKLNVFIFFIFIFIFYIVFELYLYWVVGGIYMYGGCWRREGPIISLFVTLSSSEVWLIDWFSYKLIQKRLESNEYWILAATTDDEWADLCHLSAPTINWGSGSMWRRSLVEL